MTIVERFWSKVDVSPVGCWIWQAGKNKAGYGIFSIRFRDGTVSLNAHRMAYELAVGPIPAGLVIDHLCRVKACVRPDHLEPVSVRENTLRGDTAPARNAQKATCPRGHPYDYLSPGGRYRGCRACYRWHEQKRAERRSAA